MVRLLPEFERFHLRLRNAFNPTMVRLLQEGILEDNPSSLLSIPQWCDCCLPQSEKPIATVRTFNPTMVRLLLVLLRWDGTMMLSFQSHNGAIAASSFIRDIQALRNSFQSHNGAIAANLARKRGRRKARFQSHNGAIAARFVKVIGCDTIAFNPTMVRLLLLKLGIGSTCLMSFQSHNGAIAAFLGGFGGFSAIFLSIPQWCDCCCALAIACPPKALHFQSHNGAIAARISGGSERIVIILSIPQWCDCCQGKILGFKGKRKGNGEGVAVDLRLPENP